MSATSAIAVAVVLVWLGMVLAISFLEAPLKFRAPGITVPLALGIGRLVFRALNVVEAVWAVVLIVTIVLGPPPVPALIAVVVAVVALATQLAVIRPPLSRRTAAVLAGETTTPTHAHQFYIALEGVKTIALLVAGVLLLIAGH